MPSYLCSLMHHPDFRQTHLAQADVPCCGAMAVGMDVGGNGWPQAAGVGTSISGDLQTPPVSVDKSFEVCMIKEI